MVQSGKGDSQALLLELFNQNLGLIETVIKRYRGIEDLDDLRQEAFFGLSRAVELWDPDKGSFANYLAYWVHSAVRRYIDDCGGVIRVPSNRRALMGRYNKAMNDYRVRFGRDPSSLELCCALDLTEKQLEELRRDVHALRIRSTEEVVGGDDDDILLGDTVPDDHDHIADVVEKIHREEQASALWHEVDALPDRESTILHRRYEGDRTYRECAADLGISVERVRQLHESALRKLRRPQVRRRLVPYLADSAAYSIGIKSSLASFHTRGESAQERAMILLENKTGPIWGNLRTNYGELHDQSY